MLVQAGAEPVDEGNGTHVRGRINYLRRPVALHKVAKSLWHLSSTHWRTGTGRGQM